MTYTYIEAYSVTGINIRMPKQKSYLSIRRPKNALKHAHPHVHASTLRHTYTYPHLIWAFEFAHHCLSVLFNLLSFLPHLEKYIC